MSTVDKSIADKVIEGRGYYPGDRMKVIEIIKYQNQFNGADAYKLVYQGINRNAILSSPAVLNPTSYWRCPDH